MTSSSNDRVQRIIDATSEVENDEELARVTGEALLLVASRGRSAWEELFEMLDSSERGEHRGEIKEFFRDWLDRSEGDE